LRKSARAAVLLLADCGKPLRLARGDPISIANPWEYSRGISGSGWVAQDNAYDTADHVAELRVANVTPHVTQNNGTTKTGKARSSAIDARTTRHAGYGMSQTRRKMIGCIFGWGKKMAQCARPSIAAFFGSAPISSSISSPIT
jgi:hypothetical protein